MRTFSEKFGNEGTCNHSWVGSGVIFDLTVQFYTISTSKNQAFMMNVKGTRNCILGTGVEINYGIFRDIWTFSHSHQ